MGLSRLVARVTVCNRYFWMIVLILIFPIGFYKYLDRHYPVDTKIIKEEILMKTSPYFCEHIHKKEDASKIWREVKKNIHENGMQSQCKPRRLLFNVTNSIGMPFDSFDHATQHECVLNIVEKYKQLPNSVVPNVVHNIWMDPRRVEFRFHHFMCMLSMLKHQQPGLVIIWYDQESSLPRGIYWLQLLLEAFGSHHGALPHASLKTTKTLPDAATFEAMYQNRRAEPSSARLIFVQRYLPLKVFTRSLVMNEHRTDVVRLEALLLYGGIYLDNDVLVLRSFDQLRTHGKAVLGYEAEKALCNSVIVAPRSASFLLLWYAEYESFDNREWSYHSVHLPGLLAERCPQYVHAELDTINRPSWKELDLLYGIGNYANLSRNYAVHLWFRFHDVNYSPESIFVVQTTVGRLFRQVYYGVSW